VSDSSRSDIQERVLAVIAEVLSIDATEISPQASISDDLGATSIDKVELILTIEDEFGGSIPEQDIEKIITVGDVIDYIENNLKAT
jgi:acyl carrier protein